MKRIFRDHGWVIAFIAAYVAIGGAYFVDDGNLEFMIYVGVIVGIFGVLFATLPITKLPPWILWLLSVWGLLHILGGAVPTPDGVLFAYRIYPFLDRGGDFYVLKYDQVVHAYLYGVAAVAFWYMLRDSLRAAGSKRLIMLIALMAAMGVSAMNEIMEFLIAVNFDRNGVGGYENTLLDLIFNFAGAAIAMLVVALCSRKTYDMMSGI